MSFLAIPGSARASPTPSSSRPNSPKRPGGGGGGKKRQAQLQGQAQKVNRSQLDRVVLDEEDDVDDSDLIAVPSSRRRVDEEYDEDDEDDNDNEQDNDGAPAGDGDVDVDGDMDGDIEPRRTGGGAMKGGNAGGSGGARAAMVRENRAAVARGLEIDKKGKKRRAETFLLRDQLDPDQAKRFDTFSTVALNKNAIKRLNRDLYDQHCPPQVCMVVAGMAKIYIADVIELAKDLQPYSAHPSGPLQPYHLKLARMQLEQSGLINDSARSGGMRGKKAIFRRQ